MTCWKCWPRSSGAELTPWPRRSGCGSSSCFASLRSKHQGWSRTLRRISMCWSRLSRLWSTTPCCGCQSFLDCLRLSGVRWCIADPSRLAPAVTDGRTHQRAASGHPGSVRPAAGAYGRFRPKWSNSCSLKCARKAVATNKLRLTPCHCPGRRRTLFGSCCSRLRPPQKYDPQGTAEKTDPVMRSLSNSNARIPASELPEALSAGDQTQMLYRPGTTATMPPPTPLLPGRPTR